MDRRDVTPSSAHENAADVVPGVGPNDRDGERRRFLDGMRALARANGVVPEPAAMTREHLDAGDPTGGMRREVAIVSMGNACEAHGMALAPDIDDRTAIAIAARVACASGARYVGHAPFATDGVGDLARAWSPAYLPFDDFYAKTVALVRTLFAAFYDDAGAPRPKLVLFVSGHGGNGVLGAHLERLACDLGVARCLYSLSMRPAEGGVQHADGAEHAVARALGAGCIDAGRLETAAAAMHDDAGFARSLHAHPALGGMSGFYIFGDERFDALRARYPGLKSSVRAFAEHRRVDADEARGHAIIDHTTTAITRELIDAATALGVEPPWFAK